MVNRVTFNEHYCPGFLTWVLDLCLDIAAIPLLLFLIVYLPAWKAFYTYILVQQTSTSKCIYPLATEG